MINLPKRYIALSILLGLLMSALFVVVLTAVVQSGFTHRLSRRQIDEMLSESNIISSYNVRGSLVYVANEDGQYYLYFFERAIVLNTYRLRHIGELAADVGFFELYGMRISSMASFRTAFHRFRVYIGVPGFDPIIAYDDAGERVSFPFASWVGFFASVSAGSRIWHRFFKKRYGF